MKTKKYENLLEEIKKLQEENIRLKKRKKYGLVWEDKPELFDEESKNALPVLIEKGGRFKDITSDENDDFNILIEGDNYHSLSVLKYTHRNKIDVIYIDPPYNTGNKDFIYNDHIVDKEDTFRHSKWLSFMNKRLDLAKSLLKDDGVIFISIDDNEQAQLKLLCDEVFGHENFINNITVKSKESSGASGGGEDSGFKKNKEYLLVYSKNRYFLDLHKDIVKKNLMKYIQERRDNDIGFYYTRVLVDLGEVKLIKKEENLSVYEHTDYIFKSINMLMKEENISEEEVYVKYFEKIFMVTNAQSSLPEKAIRVANGGKQRLLSYKYIPKSGKFKNKLTTKYVWNETLIVWLHDSSTKDGNSIYKISDLGDLWMDLSWGRLDLEGHIKFKNGKKPISLIKRICKKNSITVLDFMAGSGTTGHAVLDLNKEDGGDRKFILCTNNENKICEDITWERLKKVSCGYLTPRNKKVSGLGGNLKYLKTDFIKVNSSIDDLKEKIVEASTEIICLKENTFKLVEDNYKEKRIKVFENKNSYTAILFDIFYFEDFIKTMKKLTDKHISVYVFSYDKDFSKEEFAELSNTIDFTVEAIPEKLLETYQDIFNF